MGRSYKYPSIKAKLFIVLIINVIRLNGRICFNLQTVHCERVAFNLK